MARLSPLLLLLLQLQPSASRLIRPDWNISVSVHLTSPVLRAISASAASFVYEGTLSWYWRDDSLRTFYESGDLIDSVYTAGSTTLYGTYNNTNRVVREACRGSR
jgi:hypothetical protein